MQSLPLINDAESSEEMEYPRQQQDNHQDGNLAGGRAPPEPSSSNLWPDSLNEQGLSTAASAPNPRSRTTASLQTVAALNLPRYYYPTAPISMSSSSASPPTTAAAPPAPPSTPPLSPRDIMITKRRKELFGDCALIEIIHLHDCLRGALKSLQEDVKALTQQIIEDSNAHKQDRNRDATEKAAAATTTSTLETTETTSFVSAPTTNAASSLTSKNETRTPTKNPRSNTNDDNNNTAKGSTDWIDLERSVAGRFKVIWSVFRAHSSAEDEFIWPALRSKMQPHATLQATSTTTSPTTVRQAASSSSPSSSGKGTTDSNGLVQEEYEEDHADEERMFSEMDALLTSLREILSSNSSNDNGSSYSPRSRSQQQQQQQPRTPSESSTTRDEKDDIQANVVAHKIRESTKVLSDHLMHHLEKEETQCMPLVVKHLSKTEIHDLVGNIMGKRSADTIGQIMTMAVQSLAENEREEMIQYMKQSMQNTFFDRWLSASGWGQTKRKDMTASGRNAEVKGESEAQQDSKPSASFSSSKQEERTENMAEQQQMNHRAKRARTSDGMFCMLTNDTVCTPASYTGTTVVSPTRPTRPVQITSQAELEKLIRAIATNPALNAQQKNATIQGLRDSVWKSNEKEKQRRREPESPPAVAVNAPLCATTVPFLPQIFATHNNSNEVQQRPRVGLPPSAYYKKTGDSKVELVWKNDGLPHGRKDSLSGDSVPRFSASELAPTFHDGATGAVLGCPHYARACKLRHPKSGRLYTCRLCCDQARELPAIRGGGQEDEKLDRYAVTEVMCMTCNTLQPAEDRCINPDCESYGRPFAKYFCNICHLYDGSSRPIFHCPYCKLSRVSFYILEVLGHNNLTSQLLMHGAGNTCRLGLGLGIDFRHCMRCNACVSLEDKDHQCIPQKLQGSCPICHETLFQSTEPLRGLKCGHVMHMTCYTQYRRTSYTCPLCMRSMEDMKDHFALLDAGIRMQPMPASFLHTMSNIYCQDCGKTGQVQYHFVGQKCPHCNSYNTREMGRVHNPPPSYS